MLTRSNAAVDLDQVAGVKDSGDRVMVASRDVPVIRAMPNTPCLLGKGATVVAGGAHATEQHLTCATTIFSNLGRCLTPRRTAFLDAVDGATIGERTGVRVRDARSARGWWRVLRASCARPPHGNWRRKCYWRSRDGDHSPPHQHIAGRHRALRRLPALLPGDYVFGCAK